MTSRRKATRATSNTLKERRSSQDAEDVLAGALERLRARRSFPPG
ncbi:RNA polymerase-binding protein RbpA [Arthrobacter sp. H16F315]|nr:RNA polymerase-binding protein RbpA [Arthrobacter sp. H16F315]MDD1477637.1 RNA polymerase-binding protein RbpA [Arthrobacter sp. H16F315]